MGWWRGSVCQRGCWRRGRGVKEREKKTEGEFTAQTLSCPAVFSSLSCLPALSNLFCSRACYSTPSVYLTSWRVSASPDPLTAQTLQSAHISQLGRWQSAAEPVGRNHAAPSMLCPQHVTYLVWHTLSLGDHLIIHFDRVAWPSSYAQACSGSMSRCLNL